MKAVFQPLDFFESFSNSPSARFRSSMSVNNMYQPVIRPSVSRAGGRVIETSGTRHRHAAGGAQDHAAARFRASASTHRSREEIIRMDSVEVGRILPFLSRLAEIFQGLAVEKFDLTGRTQGKHKSRNGVDDQTKAFLTLLERRLVALALNCNRRQMRNLLDDLSSCLVGLHGSRQ